MGILVFLLVIAIVLFGFYVNKKKLAIDESQLDDDLQSSLGIDYRKLRNLLASGSFKEANLETKGIFGKFITGKYEIIYGDLKDHSHKIEVIPSKDLLTINNLWFKYSNGLYAFSVQCAIFHEIYNRLMEENVRNNFHMTNVEIKRKTWTSFRKEVGWQDSDSRDSILILNKKGHFPNVFGRVSSIGGLQSMVTLFNRIKELFVDDD